MPETVVEILEAYRTGRTRPSELVKRSFQRLRAYNDPATFISVCEEQATENAAALERTGDTALPLYGIPVSVKDNIDVAGLPTTAACPAFSRTPDRDATAVARLKQAGAIVIGKSNLDQFATGLVGVRSPYGVPRNPFHADLIPGGSSSGSAVTVAVGVVPLALGTDTAGSGRVPAGLNNIVGLKPSVGMVSTAGVVPACRSLDCVSIFALTVDDGVSALEAMAGPDPDDPFSRQVALGRLGNLAPRFAVAIPRERDLDFFGDLRAETAFETAVRIARKMGAYIQEISLVPFFEAARLLYEGPWIAERYAAVGEFIDAHPDEVHPITREIIAAGKLPSAVDTFRALYRLMELRKQTDAALAPFDALLVPTIPAAYSIQQVLADPIRLNSRLGVYTNFVNLLDLCALSVPTTLASDGTPFGATFIAPAGHDAKLASLGLVFHSLTDLPLGATRRRPAPLAKQPIARGSDILLAVVGAHLSGMPLNVELREIDATLVEAAVTSPDYRLFELETAHPPKPGLLRVAPGTGRSIEVEIWALAADAFGKFVGAVPPPLTIGTIELRDGRQVKGFLVEAEAVNGARDISSFGGWRAYAKRGLASA